MSSTSPSSIQKYPRYRVSAPVDVVTALSEHKGLPLENISLGGVFIRTDEPPPPGAKVKLALHAGAAPVPTIGLVGRVVHVIDEETGRRKAHPPGIGVQFEGLTSESAALLERFVEGLAERARREKVRRAGARFVDHVTVWVRPEREVLGELWSQSLRMGGLFAEGDPPPLGAQVTVVIGAIHCRAEVVHVQSDGAGLQLKDLDGARHAAVKRFVEGATDVLVYREERAVGPPLGKVLAVVRRLFAGLEEGDGVGALGLSGAPHENEVKTRAEGLRRLFSVRPPGATPPQLARIETAQRAVARAESLALGRIVALRAEAQLVVKPPPPPPPKPVVDVRAEARKAAAEAAAADLRRAIDLLTKAEVFVNGVGMKEQAIAGAREAARLTTVREARLRAIRVLAKAGEHADAELLAQELLEQNPRDALAWQSLMLIHEKQKQWAEAAKAGEALVRLKPLDEDLAKRVRRFVEEARRQRH